MSNKKVNRNGTCRLCLEDIGQCVIVPKIREQIKYCFDINVEPLDGLPQLLCTNCECILKDFFEIKKSFILKQNDLFRKSRNKKQRNQQHSEQTSGENRDPNPALNNLQKKSSAATRRYEIASSFVDNKNEFLETIGDSNEKILWPSSYTKQFSCTLCNHRVNKKTSILRHIKMCHKSLKKKHESVLRNKCEVKIDKIDRKPNITGFNDTVVINNDKIIQQFAQDYCIYYISKESKSLQDKNDRNEERSVRKRKKSSSSSNGSLELEKREIPKLPINVENTTKEMIHEECICIEDSSESATEENNTEDIELNLNSNTPGIPKADLLLDKITTIKDIVSRTNTRFKRKVNRPKVNGRSHTKSQLKHKVLSIGRKIINRQGFNCTGLLRYMEHKNLEILWTPNISNSISDTNFVRIMMKLRGNSEDEEELGWKTLPPSTEVQLDSVTEPNLLPNNTQMLQKSEKKLLNENPVANPKQMPRKSVVVIKYNEPVTLDTEIHSNSSNNNTTSTLDCDPWNKPTSVPIIDIPQKTNAENENECGTEATHNVQNNEAELSTARIKVKPLSELLSDKGLNKLISNKPHRSLLLSPDKQKNKLFNCIVSANNIIQASPMVQPIQITKLNDQAVSGSQTQSSPIVLTHQLPPGSIVIQPSYILQQNQIVQASHIVQPIDENPYLSVIKSRSSGAPSTRTEYVTMDTPDLPNTKTHSPLDYLKSLLRIHNIDLLETKEQFSDEFVCLIRFKVLYNQDTLDNPILLFLSLLCHTNKFCMHVENEQSQSVVLSDISANWQWEIIRVFIGEVANKLLQNAKKVNLETYKYAKTFLDLLMSINYSRQ